MESINARLGWSVDLEGDTAVLGAPDPGGPSGGSALVYERGAGMWAKTTELAPGIPVGGSVAVSQDMILLGSPEEETVLIFEEENGRWTESAQLTPPDGSPVEDFGFSMDVDGEKLIVGAEEVAAYIYEREDGRWAPAATLTAPEGATNFGMAVGIDGTTAVVAGGAFSDGSAFVYEETSDGWSQAARLDPDGSAEGFGRTVAISQGHVAVGARWADPAGHVFLYARVDDGWHLSKRLGPQDVSPAAHAVAFGASVAMEGDQLLVGAVGEDRSPGAFSSPSDIEIPCQGVGVTTTCERPGAAYVFTQTGSGWEQTAKLSPAEGAPGDWFGHAVSLTESSVLVGSPRFGDLTGLNPGAGHIFTQAATTLE